MKLEKIKARGGESLYRHPKTGIIYFRRYRKGVGDVTRSLKTTVFEDAKEARDKLLQRPFIKKHERLTALELFDDFIETKKLMNRREATITSLLASRKHLAPYFEAMFPEDITSDWWTKIYIPEIRKATHAKRKFFNDRKWLLGFTRWLHNSGKISRRWVLENPDPPTERAKIFTDEEVTMLVQMAPNKDLRLAILMASTMGMRRSEIYKLRVDRVDIKSKTINLQSSDTKTKKPRSMRISGECEAEVLARATKNKMWIFESAQDPFFPLHRDGFKRAWAQLKNELGITGRFHWLRHTFLTKAFKAPGANPALICDYAGLSIEIAQKIYLHFDANDTASVANLVKYE